MPGIQIEGFQGVVPRMSPTLLEYNQAQTAYNSELFSGTLRPWPAAIEVMLPGTTTPIPLVPGAITVYRLNNGSTDCWLSWAEDVDFVPGVVADVSDYRVYYTGDGITPRKTNYALASSGPGPYPAAYYELGVPGPGPAPTLTMGGTGSGVATTVSYVYTWLTMFGSVKEESAPSLAASISVQPGNTVTITGFATPPAGNYNYQYLRIYATITGASSVTYEEVVELPIATTTYTDTAPGNPNGGVALQTIGWGPHPSNMKGLVSMPNGILAGFVANEVWFSASYYPHTWPAQYVLTVDWPIVGLAVSGSTLLVMTTRNPYAITGVVPSVLSQQKLDIEDGCVSKRSIAADQFGVLYAGPNGVVSLSSATGQQDVITRPLYSYDDWRALNPSTMFGRLYDSIYTLVMPPTDMLRMMRADTPPLTTYTYPAQGLYVDPVTNFIYAINALDGHLYQLDANAVTPQPFTWTSKRFLLPEATAFAAMQVDADYTALNSGTSALYQQVSAANQALYTSVGVSGITATFGEGMLGQYVLAGGNMGVLPAGNSNFLTVEIVVDGVVAYTTNMRGLDAVRVPPVKGYAWEFTLSGTLNTRSFGIATSIAELKQRGEMLKQIKYVY